MNWLRVGFRTSCRAVFLERAKSTSTAPHHNSQFIFLNMLRRIHPPSRLVASLFQEPTDKAEKNKKQDRKEKKHKKATLHIPGLGSRGLGQDRFRSPAQRADILRKGREPPPGPASRLPKLAKASRVYGLAERYLLCSVNAFRFLGLLLWFVLGPGGLREAPGGPRKAHGWLWELPTGPGLPPGPGQHKFKTYTFCKGRLSGRGIVESDGR